MELQQITALALVVLAALYLGRQFVGSVRSFFSARGGCGSGCGKCAFAREIAENRAGKAPARVNIIPLQQAVTRPQDRSARPPV